VADERCFSDTWFPENLDDFAGKYATHYGSLLGLPSE
jgi:hypothetical protein